MPNSVLEIDIFNAIIKLDIVDLLLHIICTMYLFQKYRLKAQKVLWLKDNTIQPFMCT